MNGRSFLTGAGTLAGAAALPFTALIARAQDPDHRGGIRRGHTAVTARSTPDQTTGVALIALPEGFRYLTFG